MVAPHLRLGCEAGVELLCTGSKRNSVPSDQSHAARFRRFAILLHPPAQNVGAQRYESTVHTWRRRHARRPTSPNRSLRPFKDALGAVPIEPDTPPGRKPASSAPYAMEDGGTGLMANNFDGAPERCRATPHALPRRCRPCLIVVPATNGCRDTWSAIFLRARSLICREVRAAAATNSVHRRVEVIRNRYVTRGSPLNGKRNILI